MQDCWVYFLAQNFLNHVSELNKQFSIGLFCLAFFIILKFFQSFLQLQAKCSTFFWEVASVTLHNTQNENKRAKSERSFARLLFYFLK